MQSACLLAILWRLRLDFLLLAVSPRQTDVEGQSDQVFCLCCSLRGAHHGTLTTHVLPFSTPNPDSKEAHQSTHPPNIAHRSFALAEGPSISNHRECSDFSHCCPHSIYAMYTKFKQFGILSLSVHSSYLIPLCLHTQPATTTIKCRYCSAARQRADDPIHQRPPR